MWGADFSDYMLLLLSNDIISELKSLLYDYGDALVHAGWSGWGGLR